MTTAVAPMKCARLAPWFGANTELAGEYARQLGRLRWCAVPFAGGMCELPLIQTVAGVASDLHRHIINLARVVRDTQLKAELIDRLDGLLFHPDELAAAQRRCMQREIPADGTLFEKPCAETLDGDVGWAADYFIACWMGRGGHAGKQTEFTQGLALRYTSSGGDSAKRFRTAIESLDAWHLALRIWSFDCVDGMTVLARVRDQASHGIYCDPPWPDAGNEYAHRFPSSWHSRLRDVLASFTVARVVLRYGDHPLIRDLYSGDRWTIVAGSTRNQKNTETPEIMILNGPMYEGTA